MKIYQTASALAFLLLAGCASHSPSTSANNPATHIQTNTDNSAFFSNAALLTPVPERPGVKRYLDPNAAADSKAIRTIYIAPIKLWLDPESEYKDISESDIAEITAQVRQAYQNDPGHRYQVVDSPTADSLTVRAALTNVKLTKARTRLLSFTPVGLVLKGIKSAAGVSAITVESFGISAEGETPSGKTIFLVRVEPSAVATNPDGSSADTSRLDQIPDRLLALAKDLRAELGRAH